MKPIHILGISCSTRMLAVSVHYHQQLIDYAITLGKQAWSNEKLQKFVALIAQYCTQHRITAIALVTPQVFYQTDESTELFVAITKLAAKKDITLVSYPIAEIYQTFGNRINPTRTSLIRRITMFYGELEHLEQKELQNKNKYYIKLFEAVAAASILALAKYEKQG